MAKQTLDMLTSQLKQHNQVKCHLQPSQLYVDRHRYSLRVMLLTSMQVLHTVTATRMNAYCHACTSFDQYQLSYELTRPIAKEITTDDHHLAFPGHRHLRKGSQHSIMPVGGICAERQRIVSWRCSASACIASDICFACDW
jgi:hypothetical protein